MKRAKYTYIQIGMIGKTAHAARASKSEVAMQEETQWY